MQHPQEPVRFADILTTASAAANYLGESHVVPQHLLYAIAILRETMTLEDLGRAVSPLVRRTPPGMGGTVDPKVRELAQRWFEALGSDAEARISSEQLAELIAELEGLGAAGEDSRVLPD